MDSHSVALSWFLLWHLVCMVVANLAEENREEAKLYALFKGRLQTRRNNAVVHQN